MRTKTTIDGYRITEAGGAFYVETPESLAGPLHFPRDTRGPYYSEAEIASELKIETREESDFPRDTITGDAFGASIQERIAA